MFAGLLILVRRAAQLTFVIGALVALITPSAFGQGSVVLAWDASPDPTVVGYNIYYGTASRMYTNQVPVGNATLATVAGLAPATIYYFAATTVNAAGLESDFSTEASYAVPAVGSNQPPTIDPLPAITINENSGPTLIQLTGISAGTTNVLPTINISAVSSDTNLISSATVAYTSPETTGTLTLVPGTNAYGAADQ